MEPSSFSIDWVRDVVADGAAISDWVADDEAIFGKASCVSVVDVGNRYRVFDQRALAGLITCCYGLSIVEEKLKMKGRKM